MSLSSRRTGIFPSTIQPPHYPSELPNRLNAWTSPDLPATNSSSLPPMAMEHEPGDDYIRRTSTFIRTNERALAEAGLPRRTRRRVASQPTSASVLNPLGWFGASVESTSPPPKPVNLVMDTHHLFYLLMRLEDIGIDVGTLDVKVDNPSRPMNYINIFRDSDKSDTLSMTSFRSSLSAISGLSLGGGWWGHTETRSIDAELKYIFSSFTKIPSLVLVAPGPKIIAELANEPPNENCLPLDPFKNLQSLECTDIDPRTILGWDRLSDSLRSLTIKRSGMEDVSDIFIGAVLDDQGRREGTTSRSRRRHISSGPSRQASFYVTSLPDSVPEAENEDSLPPTPTPGNTIPLPGYKWAFLKHLSLSDNGLTFLPTDPLQHLSSLSHLDLSSNLLVSIPPGLSSLYSLVSLNLADNMIDSVLGIYTQLGQILYLNLSRNRLESICGLERLLALERVDLRHNIIEESGEVGRLATLPHIKEVWIEGNPLVALEEGYRVGCFEHFWKEGKSIMLDGSAPGWNERRGMTSPPPQQAFSNRPTASNLHSPPVVAVGVVKTAASKSPAVPTIEIDSSSPVGNDSPVLAPVGVVGKERKRKNKRIVDLDGNGESEDYSDTSPKKGSHIRHQSDGGPKSKSKSKSRKDQSPSPAQATALLSIETQAPTSPIEAATSSPSGPSTSPISPVHKRSHHNRYQTEFSPPSIRTGAEDEMSIPDLKSLNSFGSLRGDGRSRTLSKSTARRHRVSASVFDNPTDERESLANDADAYRKRIEALQNDMGEGWLKVFNQTQLGSPTLASQ